MFWVISVYSEIVGEQKGHIIPNIIKAHNLNNLIADKCIRKYYKENHYTCFNGITVFINFLISSNPQAPPMFYTTFVKIMS